MRVSARTPTGEAANVDMELIQPGVVAVASELDLELQFVLGEG
jgi:hypothetical protein